MDQTFQPELTKGDLEAAARIAARVHGLVSVHLNSLNLRADPNYQPLETLDSEGNPPGAVEETFAFSYGADVVNRDAETIRVSARLTVVAGADPTDEDFDPASAPVNLDAVHSLTYQVESAADLVDEDCASFAKINGIYNVWPYWRELVDSLFGRMNLPRLLIPVFRVPRIVDDSESSDES